LRVAYKELKYHDYNGVKDSNNALFSHLRIAKSPAYRILGSELANPSDRTHPNQPGITEKRGRREAITLDDDQRQMETILHNSDVQTRSTTWEPLYYQVGLDVSGV
jgi:hypothetical protein